METSLSGKTVVVTGVTAGIGLATAERLVQRGSFVIGVGRSVERCGQTQSYLLSLVPGARAVCLTADLSEQSAVRNVAEQIRQAVRQAGSGGIDALVNNAGTFRYWLTLTSEGFEMQWAVNHLAPFLLTHELLPLLKTAPLSRVVTVSSGSHYHTRLRWDDIQLRRRYNGLLAYKQTKLANILFTAEFNRRVNTTVRAFAADPGLVNTDIGAKTDSILSRWIWNIRRRGGISAKESAKGIVFLVSEPCLKESDRIYWLHGKPKSPSPYALDEEVAHRLWELSEKMCALTPGGFGS
jgi:NAD(P)-dependent dehydrogenase (short-subunit alcohol dehydrogenase family)